MTANNSVYQTASEITESIKAFADDVRATTPLVHCITNYVTVESCANAVLAVGASPIMSDEPADVVDITSICNALVLNIGTLNMQTIAGMKVAGARAAELEHAIVLDPVGAGASALRTQTAGELLDSLPVALVRGNMSEVKALAGQAAATQGVDVNPADAVTSEEDIAEAAAFARDFAAKANCAVAITGPIDIVATRYGCRIQGATEVALTKMDVLSYMKEIPICAQYEVNGKKTDDFPFTAVIDEAKPVMTSMPGWNCDISGIRKYEDLPQAARDYVEYIEKAIGVRISYVSVGAGRDEIIYR